MSFCLSDFGQGAHTYCVRLLTYIVGKNVSDCPLTNGDLYRVGQLVGNVNKILQEVIILTTSTTKYATFNQTLGCLKFASSNLCFWSNNILRPRK